MKAFSAQAIEGLIPEIDEEINLSGRNAVINNKWNIRFRVALLFIGIFIVVCSSIASSSEISKGYHEYWSVVSAILGGASTALSAFAFNQFNFESRQRVWLDRASALKVVRDRIRLGDQGTQLLADLAAARSWNDYNPPQDEVFRRLLSGRAETLGKVAEGFGGPNETASALGDTASNAQTQSKDSAG